MAREEGEQRLAESFPEQDETGQRDTFSVVSTGPAGAFMRMEK